jgi:glycosyltransferase involved in cell wall biosynthesis
VRGNEASFLNIEAEHLLKEFNRVVVVPETIKEAAPVDHPGVEVDTSYAKLFSASSNWQLTKLSLSSRILSRGIREAEFPRFSPKAWRRMIAFTGKAELTRLWATDFLLQRGLDPGTCLFYTYWLDSAAAGIELMREQFPHIMLISRAHGYDIYEEEYYNPPFWPCRRTTLENINRVYADSYAGTDYLKSRYKNFAHKFETSLLGVRDPGFRTAPSSDGVFRIVSCSRISPEKRVDLLLEGVAAAARRRPDQKFEWHHFGNGEQRESLQHRADVSFPSNAKAYFPGFSDGEALMTFYRNNPIDVFVNSSSTEGTSVAIMEALSCGIPILATSVGGNVEVVSDQNGRLVSADASAEDMASGLLAFSDDPDPSAWRAGSRKKWLTEYNADVNFPTFAQNLKSLRLAK